MTCRVRDVMEWIDEHAPFELAESWDRVGLQIGDPVAQVRHVRVALTLTEEVAAQAEADGVDMVVTHHPVIFKPAGELRWDRPAGRLSRTLLRSGISVHVAHTNFDAAAMGTSYLLADRLSLVEHTPLVPLERSPEVGMGRIGRLQEPLSAEDFLTHVYDALEIRGLRTCGPMPRRVERVAVMGGSGASFLSRVAEMEVDAFITGDLDFHDALEAHELGMWTLDAGHFATERWIVPYWIELLRNRAREIQADLEVSAANEQDPFLMNLQASS